MIYRLLLLLYLSYFIYCQNILQQMLEDKMIKKFSSYANNSVLLSKYFKNQALTIFVPSDEAINRINLDNLNKDLLFQAHMFESKLQKSFLPVLGTTENWDKYTLVQANGLEKYYAMQSLDNINRLFMYKEIPETWYCNDAKVIEKNKINGSQVYHIIDRVLINYQSKPFLIYLKSNNMLSISYDFWMQLNHAAEMNQLPADANYQSLYSYFLPTYPVTVLVPTNDAWSTLGSSTLNSLKQDLSQLIMTMNRYYIPNTILFLKGQDVNFNFGFNSTVVPNVFMRGLINKNLQVNIQNYNAYVTTSNIPVLFGVIHLIDNPLYAIPSPDQVLEKINYNFVSKIRTFPSMNQYLNYNYSFLAMDDPYFLSALDRKILEQTLLNSFLPGNSPLSVDMGIVKTVGNLSIRLRLTNGEYFVDTLSTVSKNSWIRVAKVLTLNQMVGPTYMNVIKGLITNMTMTCSEMLSFLNGNIYASLIVKTNITLYMGSPYTLFVPSDTALKKFMSLSNISSTSSQMQYILQRMIIANRLVLDVGDSSFKAATMNYAALKEMISISITGKDCKISYDKVSFSFNFDQGGYYCYSSRPEDSSRFNLIYPVEFVLYNPDTPLDKICINPSCSRSQVLRIDLLMIFWLFFFTFTFDILF